MLSALKWRCTRGRGGANGGRGTSGSRGRWRNFLCIFSLHFLLQLGLGILITNSFPPMLNFGLGDFGLDGWRGDWFGWFLQRLRSRNYQSIPLDFGKRPASRRRANIDICLALDFQALNGAGRVLGKDIVIRPIIVNYFVLNRDVSDVHRLIDVGNVVTRRIDVTAQDGLADETNIDKIVVGRTNIELDIYVSANGATFIDNSRPTWRQWCPTNLIATGAPRNPSRSPFQIAAGEPNPAHVFQSSPPTIVIGGPTKIFVGNPRPAVVGVAPIAVGIRAQIRVAPRDIGLPAVAVIGNLDPVAAGEIIIE